MSFCEHCNDWLRDEKPLIVCGKKRWLCFACLASIKEAEDKKKNVRIKKEDCDKAVI